MLAHLPRLKRVSIGSNCLKSVRIFIIEQMNKLESISIGVRSFTRTTYTVQERNDGSLRIADCPNLKTIQFDLFAFSDYQTLDLSQLDSLQSIVMGQGVFYYAPEVSISGMTYMLYRLADLPQLQSLSFGQEVFDYCHAVVFSSNYRYCFVM